MSDLLPPGAMHMDVPLWYVVEISRDHLELPGNIELTRSAAGERLLPLFTDDDLAQIFIDGSALSATHATRACPSNASLVRLFRLVEPLGVSTVVIDSPPISSNLRVATFPLAVIAAQFALRAEAAIEEHRRQSEG